MTMDEVIGITLLAVCGACFYYMACVSHSKPEDNEEE